MDYGIHVKIEGMCEHGNFLESCVVCNGGKTDFDSKSDIEKKKRELEDWVRENNIPEEDFITLRIEKSKKTWETNELLIAMDAQHYSAVQGWLGHPGTRIDYSWAGRMAAYDMTPGGDFKPGSAFRDFVFFERASDGERVVKTRHQQFKEFAKARGLVMPSAVDVENRFKSVHWGYYEKAIDKIKRKLDGDNLKSEEEKRLIYLKGKLEAYIIFKNLGFLEPREQYSLDKREMMEDRVTNYNDIIYNAEEYLSNQDFNEIDSLLQSGENIIPPQDRLVMVDGLKMERLCEEFGRELLASGVYR